VEISEFQRSIAGTYLERDRARGVDGTFRWLVEEVGELARAIRHADDADPRSIAQVELEVADALAWLTSVATLMGVDLEDAVRRYADGCPKCGATPCSCPAGERTRPSSA
jgi:NTP pyrophosphatase (non-canonical NTP hydrolase)